jgi:hypothetical protein
MMLSLLGLEVFVEKVVDELYVEVEVRVSSLTFNVGRAPAA